jgi:hypothetical protein
MEENTMKYNTKEIMQRAWQIYRTLKGDRDAKLSYALRQAWAEAKNGDAVYSWLSTGGTEIKLVAKYTAYMADEILYADGQEIKTGKKIIESDACLTAYVDGQEIDETKNVDYWKVIDIQINGKKAYKIWGIAKIAFSSATADEIEKFLNSVIENGTDDTVKKIRQKQNEIQYYANIIDSAEKQDSIPTKKERDRWERNYNSTYNDGGEGYVPHMLCLEEYQWAKAQIEKLLNE